MLSDYHEGAVSDAKEDASVSERAQQGRNPSPVYWTIILTMAINEIMLIANAQDGLSSY